MNEYTLLVFAVAFMTPKMFMDGNVLYGSIGLFALVTYLVVSLVKLLIMEREMRAMRREMLESVNNMINEIEKRNKSKAKKEATKPEDAVVSK